MALKKEQNITFGGRFKKCYSRKPENLTTNTNVPLILINMFVFVHVAASLIKPWHLLAQPVKVQVANGEIITCTHELHNQIWGTQGITFCSTFKIIPLKGYDIILGVDWLGKHSPMQIHWVDRWLKFSHDQQNVTLQGISPHT